MLHVVRSLKAAGFQEDTTGETLCMREGEMLYKELNRQRVFSSSKANS